MTLRRQWRQAVGSLLDRVSSEAVECGGDCCPECCWNSLEDLEGISLQPLEFLGELVCPELLCLFSQGDGGMP